MNKEIRKYLIDLARIGGTISYGDIMAQFGYTVSDMSQVDFFGDLIGDISIYEHNNKRPLLSALVVHKGKSTVGNGFYELAQDLNYGKASQLRKEHFENKMQKDSWEFWKNAENLSRYYNADSQVVTDDSEDEMPFFKQSEINFLVEWANQTYDKNDPVHIDAKNYIVHTLGSKTVYWSNELVKRLDEFETYNPRIWHQRGWVDTSEGKKQVAKFKPYTWARIYKKGDEYKDIFFTVGVDADEQALVYKLDYYRESASSLSYEQKEIIEKNIPDNLRWNIVDIMDESVNNWNKLINYTKKFIDDNTEIYDNLIRIVWKGEDAKKVFTNNLVRKEPELKRYKELPVLQPTFLGTNKDYEKEAKQNKDIGDAGEELVILYERKRLQNILSPEQLNNIVKVNDGEGYDIKSYDENGNVLFIEVKTTENNHDTPFYFTLNEYLFSERNQTSYVIYRVYNYDFESNTANFFIIEKPLECLLFQPMNYKVYHKE